MPSPFIERDEDDSPGHKARILRAEIVALSVANNWPEARAEWRLVGVYSDDEAWDVGSASSCLCSHFPIKEICVLRNYKNGNEAEVGNVCVKKFMGINSTDIFRSLRRIRKDIEKSLSASAIQLFFAAGVINAWERGYSLDIRLKRDLSDAQLLLRRRINRKVLRAVRDWAGRVRGSGGS